MAQESLYNIRASLPFSKTLARYLLDETQDNPERLTQYRILLPTRRACRILRETFLSLNEGMPILLPQMTPLGDVDEEDLSLLMFGHAEEFLDIPQAISPMRRQLLMAKLIGSIPEFTQGHDHALRLAKALCAFVDQVLVEDLDFKNLDKIVPDDFAAHWKITLEFLRILSEQWPNILEAEGLIDAAHRRNILLKTLAQHWVKSPPDAPIIAAGSTGSIPAAAQLLNVVAHMPRGMVILPGFDPDLDEEIWSNVAANHPQHSFKVLLHRMGAVSHDVKDLTPNLMADKGRTKLSSALMFPAQLSSRWASFGQDNDVPSMVDHLEYYSCTSQQEEAAVIALLLREAAEDKTRTAALVTPDRNLARRVGALCARWGIEVDDSAGQNILDTRLGKFIMLSLHVAQHKFDPVILLSLLKMKFCAFGQDEKVQQKLVNRLELEFLRNGDIYQSYNDLRNCIAQDNASQDILTFYDEFLSFIEPLTSLEGKTLFTQILKQHLTVLESLGKTQDQSGAEILWRGDTGEAAVQFFTDLSQHASLITAVTLDEYERILSTLIRSITVRSAYGVHPRLLILGQLEARLSDADLVIMGGLNEGVWPADSGYDPWMSRPMRERFGLPASDQAVGLSAHDFVQGFCATHVVMTRSEKIDGSPSVPSRWLGRLEVVLQASGMTLVDLAKNPYLKWARVLDQHSEFTPYKRPEPRPPVSARPKKVSVTKVEVWIQNPYAIYMHYVLGLRPLRPLRQDNDAALRGTILHTILERFTAQYPKSLGDDAEAVFLEIAKNVLDETIESPELEQYFWPRLLKIAPWYVAHEKSWRMAAEFVQSEIRGKAAIDVDGVPFELEGIADRIDRIKTDAGDAYAIVDYKSGGTFSKGALSKGKLPQLPLEALILELGGFEDVKGSADYLGYWKITGGKTEGEVTALDKDLDTTIEVVYQGLKTLVSIFRDVDTPFYAIPDTSNAPRFNDYEHVSRLKEWAALDGEEGGEAA